MKQQFFVGDKVRICDTPQKDTDLLMGWSDGMDSCCGQVGTVDAKREYQDGTVGYFVVFAPNSSWYFAPEWLTIVERHVQFGAPSMKIWCDTCEGTGEIDETLGGESFSGRDTPCPDCDGKGWWERKVDVVDQLGFGAADEIVADVSTKQEWTDKHYDNNYTLTQKDIERGFVKIDPYRVSKQWRLGSKDESGVLFHILKTVARFGEKNSREREIKALYAQIKCLAEIEGVSLDA